MLGIIASFGSVVRFLVIRLGIFHVHLPPVNPKFVSLEINWRRRQPLMKRKCCPNAAAANKCAMPLVWPTRLFDCKHSSVGVVSRDTRVARAIDMNFSVRYLQYLWYVCGHTRRWAHIIHKRAPQRIRNVRRTVAGQLQHIKWKIRLVVYFLCKGCSRLQCCHFNYTF